MVLSLLGWLSAILCAQASPSITKTPKQGIRQVSLHGLCFKPHPTNWQERSCPSPKASEYPSSLGYFTDIFFKSAFSEPCGSAEWRGRGAAQDGCPRGEGGG